MNDCAILDIADRALTAVEEMGGDTSDLRRELAFARADRCVCCGGGVPNGAIIMWSGTVATIPDGFSLCDGSNGTPDLRNRFVIGAGGTYAVGATGGSSATTQVGDVEAGPQATVSTSALPPYYALCYIMKT